MTQFTRRIGTEQRDRRNSDCRPTHRSPSTNARPSSRSSTSTAPCCSARRPASSRRAACGDAAAVRHDDRRPRQAHGAGREQLVRAQLAVAPIAANRGPASTGTQTRTGISTRPPTTSPSSCSSSTQTAIERSRGAIDGMPRPVGDRRIARSRDLAAMDARPHDRGVRPPLRPRRPAAPVDRRRHRRLTQSVPGAGARFLVSGSPL